MDAPNPARPSDSFSVLRQFARKNSPVEHCDLCSAPLAMTHTHLVEPPTRRLLCACDACALLFSGSNGTRYKRVSREVLLLSDFRLTDAQWDDLMIPIQMAFFLNSSVDRKVIAFYPSPAGATESLLPLEAWEDITGENPLLRELEPDVQALLVNRIGPAGERPGGEYYLVPIDECYKLVGLIRMHWRGLSGGSEVWQEIARFFSGLRQRARATA
jgi:hypothetical protein